MRIMNMTGYVLFWYLLGLKVTWGHTHKIRSWYLLGVAFKKSNEHPRHFYRAVPPPPPPRENEIKLNPGLNPSDVILVSVVNVIIHYNDIQPNIINHIRFRSVANSYVQNIAWKFVNCQLGF